MYSQTKINDFTKDCYNDITKVAKHIINADLVLLGIGSGMTASGGLNYSDQELSKKWYHSMGLHSIIEIMSKHWPTTIKNPEKFWGFWAQHIFHIRYEAKALQPYIDLYDIVKDKEYFICSTNVDGQLTKAVFPKNKIFSPQGDYALFQCEKPCSEELYDNKHMIDKMISKMISPLEIRMEDVPRCPKCGSNLIPNLRCDYKFVETPHLHNINEYETFIAKAKDKKLVLLELGVGLNTPCIIRYPFEQIAQVYPNAILVRINKESGSILKQLPSQSILINQDLLYVLDKLRTSTLTL